MLHNIQDHLIDQNASIKEALIRLNNIPKTLTLFVLNENGGLIGTLTDGDIRRGFIAGKSLDDQVESFVHGSFHFLNDNEIDVRRIKELKYQGIRLLPVISKERRIVRVYDLHRLNSVLPLDVVIMAGGKGQRLLPLTEKTPKSMIELGGKPILEHTIDQLISYGIDKIYISVFHLKDQIISYFGDGTAKGVKIEYIEEEKPLGTAGALSLVKSSNRDILLTNADIFSNIDYEELYLNYFEQKADVAVTSIPYTINIPYAILYEENESIIGFKEKPSRTHNANAGVYLLSRKLIHKVPSNQYYDATDLLQYAIEAKCKVIQYPHLGYWIDIGAHEDLQRARDIANHPR